MMKAFLHYRDGQVRMQEVDEYPPEMFCGVAGGDPLGIFCCPCKTFKQRRFRLTHVQVMRQA
jgi:hypothetical protein